MGTIVEVECVRASHPHLDQPRAVQAGDDPKYSCAFLIPKNHPKVPHILAAIEAEKAAKWGVNVPADVGSTFYDADDPALAGKYPDPHFRGHYVLNSGSPANQQPYIADVLGKKAHNPGMIYPGCYVSANLGFFSYDKGVSKGIACGLNGIQFYQDGDRLDGRPAFDGMFQPVPGAPPAIAPGVGDQYPAGAAPQQVPAGYPAPPAQYGAPPAPAQQPPPQYGAPPAGYPPPAAPAPVAPPPAQYAPPPAAPAQAAPAGYPPPPAFLG